MGPGQGPRLPPTASPHTSLGCLGDAQACTLTASCSTPQQLLQPRVQELPALTSWAPTERQTRSLRPAGQWRWGWGGRGLEMGPTLCVPSSPSPLEPSDSQGSPPRRVLRGSAGLRDKPTASSGPPAGRGAHRGVVGWWAQPTQRHGGTVRPNVVPRRSPRCL